jgi:hypothetical protein
VAGGEKGTQSCCWLTKMTLLGQWSMVGWWQTMGCSSLPFIIQVQEKPFGQSIGSVRIWLRINICSCKPGKRRRIRVNVGDIFFSGHQQKVEDGLKSKFD